MTRDKKSKLTPHLKGGKNVNMDSSILQELPQPLKKTKPMRGAQITIFLLGVGGQLGDALRRHWTAEQFLSTVCVVAPTTTRWISPTSRQSANGWTKPSPMWSSTVPLTRMPRESRHRSRSLLAHQR